jgi:hypothetical protein
MILPLGTRVRSTRAPNIIGKIQGYGTLFPTPGVGFYDDGKPVVVYLMWNENSPGSNSLINPTVHVLDIDQVEEQ